MRERESSRTAAESVVVETARASECRAALEFALGDDKSAASKTNIDRALAQGQRDSEDWRGLLVARTVTTALSGEENPIAGAILVRMLGGRVASVGVPHVASDAPAGTDAALVRGAADFTEREGAVLAQSVLECDDTSSASAFAAAEFDHAADLLFLVARCDGDADGAGRSHDGSAGGDADDGLDWLAYRPQLHRRLADVVERTYVGSRDCPELDGVRAIDDVLAGYRATGEFSADRWLIAVRHGRDVGCLLLADHPDDDQWELVYLGVAPESRGQGLGMALARKALAMARRAGRRQLVLAVDAANAPAIEIYRRAGFEAWERRRIFLRRFDKPREM